MKTSATGQSNYIKMRPENGIHLRDYINIVEKRYHVVLFIFLIVFFSGIVITYSQSPTYRSSTKIFVEQNEPEIIMPNISAAGINNPHFLYSQIELLKSKNVVEKIVHNLKQKDTFINSFNKKSSFFSQIREQITFFFSKHTPTQKDAKKTYHDKIKKITSALLKDIQVELRGDSNVIKISYTHHDPLIAQTIVQEITRSYIDELLDIKVSSSQYTLSWLTAQADEERKKLENLERKLHSYMRENKIITIEDKIASTPELLTDYSLQLSKARAKRKDIEEIFTQIQQSKKADRSMESLPSVASNINIQQLRDTILKIEQQLIENRTKFGNKHPLIQKELGEITLFKKEINNEIFRIVKKTKNELELAKENEKNMEMLLEETKTNTLLINEKLFHYNILKREVDTSRTLFDALIKSIKEQNVTGQTKNVNVHVIERAELPDRPSKPNKITNICFSIFFGLSGGIIFAIFLEYLDNKVSSKEQLEKLYNTRVIGEIELVERKNIVFTNVLDEQFLFFSIAESYRMIRSAITLSSATNPAKTVLITSSVKNEGKTSTCINLATVIAYDQKSVLVIDCDMRNPSLHKYLGVDNSIGLSTYLAGIKQHETIINIPDKHISIIPSGQIPPNPSELVGSAKMKALLKKLSNEYDYILIDSPPILAVTDADIINTMVDGTIIVIRANSTSYDMISASLEKIQLLKANLIGLILNGKKRSHLGTSGYYYGDYR